MAKFKVGDRVKCINAYGTGLLVLGQLYTVRSVTSDGNVCVCVHQIEWNPNLFTLEETPKPVAHVHAALIKAWADGAKIEFESWLQPGLWLPTGDAPEWSINRNYRIKPEPKPDVVRWFNIGRQLECFPTFQQHPGDNMKAVFDGETGKLKSVEMV